MKFGLSPSPALRGALGVLACAALVGCNPEGNRPDVQGAAGTASLLPPVDLPIDGDIGDPTLADPQCVTTTSEAALVKDPVDIILLVDNSSSMANEIDAVERNINDNFAQILEDNAVDYRVIVISRHRNRARTEDDAIAGICVEAPLSGVETCPAPAPIPTQRFYQYNHEVQSGSTFGSPGSLQVVLDTYRIDRDNPPPIELNPLNPQEGWSTWLRPGVKKVFLEMSDDNSAMDAVSFLGSFVEVAPELFDGNYQSPRFTFHSIVGLSEKAGGEAYEPSEPLVDGTCGGADSSGATYQELSQVTGGLRFPLCDSNAYDAVFSQIADDVVRQAPVQCVFDLPAPPAGQAVTLNNVAVSYLLGGSSTPRELAQVREVGACQDNTFYIEGEQIHLCSTPCARVQSDLDASVDVLFTCRSTLIE
jgi:hypothetical protein